MIINDENLEILRTHHEAAFEEGKASGPPTAWEQVATEIPSRGSQNLYSWLGQFPQLREWVGDRFINDLKAYDYTIQNRTFEGTIEIQREEIEDNQAFERTMLTRAMGEQARKHPDKLTYGLLASGRSEVGYDRQPFFDEDHPVPGRTYSNVDNGGAAVGQAIAGTKRGGWLVNIALGFIGALLGSWMARNLGLPELFVLELDGTRFSLVWSIAGSALFVALISFLRRDKGKG